MKFHFWTNRWVFSHYNFWTSWWVFSCWAFRGEVRRNPSSPRERAVLTRPRTKKKWNSIFGPTGEFSRIAIFGPTGEFSRVGHLKVKYEAAQVAYVKEQDWLALKQKKVKFDFWTDWWVFSQWVTIYTEDNYISYFGNLKFFHFKKRKFYIKRYNIVWHLSLEY